MSARRILLSLLILASCWAPSLAFGADRIKLGVSLPLSGEAASYGTDLKNALIFANEKLTGNSYELIIEDDKCNGKSAVTVAQKLVTVDHVAGVLGFGCSGALLAAAPIYEQAKIPVVTSCATAAAVSKAGDYIFRTVPSDELAATVLADYIAKKHAKLGVISEETEYAQGLLNAIRSSASGKPLRIENENFLPATNDFRALILKLKGKNVDAVLANPQDEAGMIRIVHQIRQLNWNVPLYGNLYPGTRVFLEGTEASESEGIIFSDIPSVEATVNTAGAALYEEFQKKFGPPNSTGFLFVTSYSAFDALRQALESGKDPKAYLYQTTFHGILDQYSFDSNGDIAGVTDVLRVIKGRKPVLLP